MKILITGGAGFIASSLADELLKTDKVELVLVDNLITGEVWKLPQHKSCRFIKCDVNDERQIAAIMIAFRFDYVFHYAALVGVKRTLDHPAQVLQDIDGIKNILTLAKNTGVRRVFFSSSSEVYGEPVHLPQHEYFTPLNSRLPYAIVKNVGEAFCRSYFQEFGLEYTIFRFFNTYGPKQSADFVVARFIKSALANEPITIYGEGTQTRTFCYIQDNLDLTILALNQSMFINDVVNIGHERLVTILELAETIISITHSKSRIVHLPPLKEGDMTRRQPDNEKMKIALGRELTPLEMGLKETIKERTSA